MQSCMKVCVHVRACLPVCVCVCVCVWWHMWIRWMRCVHASVLVLCLYFLSCVSLYMVINCVAISVCVCVCLPGIWILGKHIEQVHRYFWVQVCPCMCVCTCRSVCLEVGELQMVAVEGVCSLLLYLLQTVLQVVKHVLLSWFSVRCMIFIRFCGSV